MAAMAETKKLFTGNNWKKSGCRWSWIVPNAKQGDQQCFDEKLLQYAVEAECLTSASGFKTLRSNKEATGEEERDNIKNVEYSLIYKLNRKNPKEDLNDYKRNVGGWQQRLKGSKAFGKRNVGDSCCFTFPKWRH